MNIGRVRDFGKFSRYMVDDKNSIKILISLFNGNLVLDKKISQFNNWLKLFNISEVYNKILPSLNDAWISGFIDAKGCFNVSLFKIKTMKYGYQVKLKFMIDQKDSINKMIHIKNQLILFLSNRKLKNDTKGITMHIIESNSFVKAGPITDYLNNYKLKLKIKKNFL